MEFRKDVSRQFDRFGRRTSAFLEETRLRGAISALEGDVRDLYAAAGMLMFSEWRKEKNGTEELTKYFQAIQRKLDEIEKKKRQIAAIRKKAGMRAPFSSAGKAAGSAAAEDVESVCGLSSAKGTADGGISAAEASAEKETGGCGGVSEESAVDFAYWDMQDGLEASEGAGEDDGAEGKTEESASAGVSAAEKAGCGDIVIEVEDADDLAGPLCWKDTRGQVSCPDCGAFCPENAVFCRKCGARLPQKQTDGREADAEDVREEQYEMHEVREPG